MDTARNQTEGQVKDLKNQATDKMHDVKNQVQDTFTDVKDQAKEKIQGYTGNLKSMVGNVKDAVSNVDTTQIKESFNTFGQSSIEVVRRYPLYSILGAAAVGYLAATIARRSHR